VCSLHCRVVEVTKDNDTTGGALRAAASTLFDSMLRQDDHIFLEPCMKLEVDAPTDQVGDILSDFFTNRRAKNLYLDSQDCVWRTVVQSQVTIDAMLGYATSIRSLTQGKAKL
jgi:elongation factor G